MEGQKESRWGSRIGREVEEEDQGSKGGRGKGSRVARGDSEGRAVAWWVGWLKECWIIFFKGLFILTEQCLCGELDVKSGLEFIQAASVL